MVNTFNYTVNIFANQLCDVDITGVTTLLTSLVVPPKLLV